MVANPRSIPCQFLPLSNRPELTPYPPGIGLAAAKFLLNQPEGHKLVVVSRTESALKQLESEYGPSRVAILAGDLADTTLGSKAVDLALSRFQRLDSLLINHGVLDPVGRIADTSVDGWVKGFSINVFSAVGLIQAALPELRKTQGRIVLVSSGAATHPYFGWAAYGGTKAVLNHLAATLAVEEPEVTSVSVRPGVVDTQMQVEIREEHTEGMGSDAPRFKALKEEGGLLRPEQPGHVIAKLAVRAGKEVNGRFLSWNDKEMLGEFQE